VEVSLEGKRKTEIKKLMNEQMERNRGGLIIYFRLLGTERYLVVNDPSPAG
jgi:hypothetical protein